MRIVLCYLMEPRHVAQICAAAPGHEVVDAGQERIAQEILDADIFCGHAKVPVPWDEVVRRGRLKWIQSAAAGLDHCLTPETIASDIVVTSASGLFAEAVAEQALALLLGLLRGLPVFFERRPSANSFGGRRATCIMRRWASLAWGAMACGSPKCCARFGRELSRRTFLSRSDRTASMRYGRPINSSGFWRSRTLSFWLSR
jgi:lactate dehydrogenase-like 2-hydroxyacid dehydrogenase